MSEITKIHTQLAFSCFHSGHLQKGGLLGTHLALEFVILMLQTGVHTLESELMKDQPDSEDSWILTRSDTATGDG